MLRWMGFGLAVDLVYSVDKFQFDGDLVIRSVEMTTDGLMSISSKPASDLPTSSTSVSV